MIGDLYRVKGAYVFGTVIHKFKNGMFVLELLETRKLKVVHPDEIELYKES